MLLFDAGESQAQICEALGCSQETARYWITIAQTGQAHKWSDGLPLSRWVKILVNKFLFKLFTLCRASCYAAGTLRA
jgi:orotate phosphoribosyltransferase-like protein